MSVVRPIRHKDGRMGRREIEMPQRVARAAWIGIWLSGGAAVWVIADLIRDVEGAKETAEALTGRELTALLSLLVGSFAGMLILGYTAAIQRVRLHNIDVGARRLERFSGMGSDKHAVAAYRNRVEADALAKVQFQKETWEREREAWKAGETARIYEQVLDQLDRGLLGPAGCTRCQDEFWRDAG